MTLLADTAKELAPYIVRPGPRQNADGMARLMVMVAMDVASYNQTGRTPEMTMADAVLVMHAILDGFPL